jgi:glutathione peroxidase-family protein
LNDQEVDLSKYKGHVLIIVNVATYCGLTKANYKQLNELYDKYKDQGLKILGFPCNQFNNQEPGCSVDIIEFLKKNNVEWDVFSKIEVNGDGADPLYKWLKTKQKGILGFDGIKWNFSKFLINREGVPVNRYAPTTEPKDIEKDIKPLLTQ